MTEFEDFLKTLEKLATGEHRTASKQPTLGETIDDFLEKASTALDRAIDRMGKVVNDELDSLTGAVEESTGSFEKQPFQQKRPFQHQTPQYTTPIPSERQTRHDSLVREMQRALHDHDKAYLREAVVKYRTEVASFNTSQLRRLHSLAALYVDNEQIAEQSLKGAHNLTPREHAVLGLLAYKRGSHQAAEKYFRSADTSIPEVQLARAHMAYAAGKASLGELQAAFWPLEGKSSYDINMFLGTVAFNEECYHTAVGNFQKAAQRRPANEETLINLLTARHALGENTAADIGAFYHLTQSKKKPVDLNALITRTNIPLAEYKPSRQLYEILVESQV